MLVTEQFIEPAAAVARAAGMPGIPVIALPHPMAGTGADHLGLVAAKVAPLVVNALKGFQS